MRVAVIGSRTINDYNLIKEWLDFFLQNIQEDIIIVSGGAKGVDSISEKYAVEKGYKTQIYKPEYDKYPPKVAPLKRNTTIMQNSDIVVAFTTGSNGTAHALKEAEKLNLPIRVVKI